MAFRGACVSFASRKGQLCLLLAVVFVNLLASAAAHGQTYGVYRELYAGLDPNDNSYAALTNAPIFPNSPTSTSLLTSVFETEVNLMDGYGQRLRAFVVPPLTGNYTFWISSDDWSLLYLSTDETPMDKLLVARVNGWTSSREWTKEPNQQSPPIPLQAGRRYYLEALMKEGNGGDNLAVRWQLPNDIVEEPIPVAGRLLPFYGVSSNAPIIIAQPASTTVTESTEAISFSVLTSDPAPVAYQWQRNEVDLLGATNSVYVLTNVAQADNNAGFRCILTNPIGPTTSSVAVLTVNQDTNPPGLVRVQNLGATNVIVTFSEPVEPSSATNRFNYAVNNGVTIASATFGSNTRTIMLRTSPLQFGTNYTLVVNNVHDR